MARNQFGGFGGPNMQQLMRQAQKMQQQMAVLVAEAAYKIAASQDSEANDRKLFDQFINGDSSTVKPSNQEA